MAKDNRIIIPRGDTSAKTFAILCFKILSRCHEDVSRRVQLQILRCPLLGQVVGDNEQTLVAQTQPFALLRRRNHLPSFPSPHNVCQQGIPAIQDMGNGVDLVGPQGDLRVDPGKIDMAAVIFPRTDAVEFVIIEPCQPLPALRVFPYPILKRLLDERLFPLCDGGLFFVENGVAILVIVEDPHIPQVQRFLHDLVPIDAKGAIGVVCLDVAPVCRFALDVPFAGVFGVVYMDVPPGIVRGAEQVNHKLLYILRRQPGRTKPHRDLTGGQVNRLHLFQCLCVGLEKRISLRSQSGLLQLFAHVAGQVFIRRLPALRPMRPIAFKVKGACGRVLEDHTMQILHDPWDRLTASHQRCHISQIHTGFFGQ